MICIQIRDLRLIYIRIKACKREYVVSIIHKYIRLSLRDKATRIFNYCKFVGGAVYNILFIVTFHARLSNIIVANTQWFSIGFFEINFIPKLPGQMMEAFALKGFFQFCTIYFLNPKNI